MRRTTPPAIHPAQELRESSQTVEEEPERAGPYSAATGAQEGVGRPWWRRWFGG